jgi:hypothetical protein
VAKKECVVVGDTVNTKRINVSASDLQWMLGCSVISYSFSEPDLWVIKMSGGGMVSTQSSWRVTTPSGMVASSADHGHQFGLPAPVDAAVQAMSATSQSRIVDVRIDDRAPDLVIQLENGSVLQILATSTGYESWQTSSPLGVCIAVDGRRNASSWTEKRKG